MTLVMQDDLKEPVWVDVKDLSSAFVKRKVVEVHTRRARVATGLAEALLAQQQQQREQREQQHKDVIKPSEKVKGEPA